MSTPAPAAARFFYAATALAVLSAVLIVGDQATGDALGRHLHDLYPDRSDGDLDMVESSILTYLFTLAALGAALFLWLARAARRGGTARTWGTGAAALIAGSALAAYNFTQPHPVVVSIAGLLPCVAGLAALAVRWTTR